MDTFEVSLTSIVRSPIKGGAERTSFTIESEAKMSFYSVLNDKYSLLFLAAC